MFSRLPIVFGAPVLPKNQTFLENSTPNLLHGAQSGGYFLFLAFGVSAVPSQSRENKINYNGFSSLTAALLSLKTGSIKSVSLEL